MKFAADAMRTLNSDPEADKLADAAGPHEQDRTRAAAKQYMKLADYAPPEQISAAINAGHPEGAEALGRSRVNANAIGQLAEDTDRDAAGRIALEQVTGFSLEDFNALPDEDAAAILEGLRGGDGEAVKGVEEGEGEDWTDEEEAVFAYWLEGEGMTLEEAEALPDELYDELIYRFQEEAGGFDEGGYELEDDYYDDEDYYGEGSYEDADYEDAYEQAGPAQGGGYYEGGLEQ